MQELIAKLNLDNHALCSFSLVSDERALARRLERDISAGKRERDIIERSTARLPLYDELNTVKIDVSAITPADAAQRIAGHMTDVQADLARRECDERAG